MPMWIIMKQNPATAETGAVWNSMLPATGIVRMAKKEHLGSFQGENSVLRDAEEISAKAVLERI